MCCWITAKTITVLRCYGKISAYLAKTELPTAGVSRVLGALRGGGAPGSAQWFTGCVRENIPESVATVLFARLHDCRPETQ